MPLLRMPRTYSRATARFLGCCSITFSRVGWFEVTLLRSPLAKRANCGPYSSSFRRAVDLGGKVEKSSSIMRAPTACTASFGTWPLRDYWCDGIVRAETYIMIKIVRETIKIDDVEISNRSRTPLV